MPRKQIQQRRETLRLVRKYTTPSRRVEFSRRPKYRLTFPVTTKSKKPSLVSTVLFAIAAFLFATLFVGALADTWVPRVIGDGKAIYAARDQRDGLVSSVALGGGFLFAVFASAAWRAPAALRFHFTFFTGLSLMGFTCAYIRGQQKVAFEAAYHGASSTPFLSVPLLAALFTALALIVMLTALYLDPS